MIQRIQSIYLLLALIAITCLFFFPLFNILAETGEPLNILVDASFGAQGLVVENASELSDITIGGKYPVYLIYLLIGLLTFGSLLFYKNRKRQLFFVRIALLVQVLFVVTVYVFYYVGISMIQKNLVLTTDESINIKLAAGFFIAIAGIPFFILAIRGIKHDDNLIKSLDRLR